MKKNAIDVKQCRFLFYTAPVCELFDCLQDTICADSVGVSSEDFEKGDDYVW